MEYRHVALGGSFDFFHKGHMTLIRKAVEYGGLITIGITSDSFSKKSVEPYERRKAAVEEFLEYLGLKKYSIVKLEDTFGPAKNDASIDSLIVSDETFEKTFELKKIRRSTGLKELDIFRIPMVLAEDGGPLSSSRIRKGDIDRLGRVK